MYALAKLAALGAIFHVSFAAPSITGNNKRQSVAQIYETYIQTNYGSDFPLKDITTAKVIILDVVDHLAWVPLTETTKPGFPLTTSDFEAWGVKLADYAAEISLNGGPLSVNQLTNIILRVEDGIVNTIKAVEG